MTDFILLKQALEKYNRESQDERKDVTEVENNDGGCQHDNIIDDKGVTVCIDCGEELQSKILQDKECRSYGQGDGKNLTDSNRIQMRKIDERSIFKDVEGLGFSETIVAKANQIYAQVTQGKIFRGNSRKAIVFACIFHAYKMSGHPQSHDKLIRIFSLNRKTGLKGLKFVNLYAPKESKIRTTYITPIDLVDEIMALFSASDAQKKEVITIYEKIKNKSSRLNRSRPQSVASGLVFFWILSKNKEIALKDFAKKVGLSELTVGKLAKEIADVLEVKLE